jgi:arabinogalactan oligomer/maltooligosaccharide transport system permease protein
MTGVSTADRRVSAPSGGVTRRRGQRGPLASFGLHATLIGASVIAVFPLAWVVLTSLKTDRNAWLQPGEFSDLGFGNYGHALSDTLFGTWFVNSLIVAAGTTVLSVFIAATAGYAASRMRFPGKRAMMWLFLVVQMFPVAVLIVPLYNIMASLGLLNTHAGLVLAYCTVAVPFCAWMLKGYFDTIPVDIDEAGRIDGLSPFGTFWRLVLPLSRPGVAVTAFYSFITAWSEVAYAAIFMQSDKKYLLPTGMSTFISQFRTEWGTLAATSVLVALPAAIVFLLIQRHLVAGLTAGGTKG